MNKELLTEPLQMKRQTNWVISIAKILRIKTGKKKQRKRWHKKLKI